tara:strand:- start:442 stop:600 length:159 start_codon:yes stop_codon:yes gene_type:complete
MGIKMLEYIAPIKEIKFTLKEVIKIHKVTQPERYQNVSDEILFSVNLDGINL